MKIDFYLHVVCTVAIFHTTVWLLKKRNRQLLWAVVATVAAQTGKELWDIVIQGEAVDWIDIQGNITGLLLCLLTVTLRETRTDCNP